MISRELLHTPSASPVDTSNIPAMFTRLQQRCGPPSLKPPFWKTTAVAMGTDSLHMCARTQAWLLMVLLKAVMWTLVLSGDCTW